MMTISYCGSRAIITRWFGRVMKWKANINNRETVINIGKVDIRVLLYELTYHYCEVSWVIFYIE